MEQVRILGRVLDRNTVTHSKGFTHQVAHGSTARSRAFPLPCVDLLLKGGSVSKVVHFCGPDFVRIGRACVDQGYQWARKKCSF
jgi:hypothetical protein